MRGFASRIFNPISINQELSRAPHRVILFCANEIACKGVSYRRNFESDMLPSGGCDVLSFVLIIHGSVRWHAHREYGGTGVIMNASFSWNIARQLCCEDIPWVVG